MIMVNINCYKYLWTLNRRGTTGKTFIHYASVTVEKDKKWKKINSQENINPKGKQAIFSWKKKEQSDISILLSIYNTKLSGVKLKTVTNIRGT